MFGFMCVNDSCIGIKYGFTNPMDSSDKIGILKYNRGIQMYRFPNSDVQKSVIFEGIKKRLKIV